MLKDHVFKEQWLVAKQQSRVGLQRKGSIALVGPCMYDHPYLTIKNANKFCLFVLLLRFSNRLL